MPKNVDMPSDQKAHLLVDAVEDRKAVDPVLIDLRDKTLMSDFFLVCSGTSDTHIRAIADSVQERGETEYLNRPRIIGQSVGEWILIDFGDVVVHIMSAEARDRYKLEQFWTTPQPKGALPPTPDNAGPYSLSDPTMSEVQRWEQASKQVEDDEDDDEAGEDLAFFDAADEELEPLEDEDMGLDEIETPKGHPGPAA